MQKSRYFQLIHAATVLWGTSCSEHTDVSIMEVTKKWWCHFHGNVSQHFWAFIGDFFCLSSIHSFLFLPHTSSALTPLTKKPSPHLVKEFFPSLYWNDSSRSSRTETRAFGNSSSEKNTFCSVFSSLYSFLSCTQSIILSPSTVSATR